jgi:formylglycine-generating enzyme
MRGVGRFDWGSFLSGGSAMSCRIGVLVGLAGVLMLAVSVAQADVLNMGGTRDPVTGVWTGQASLEFVTVGDPGNAADMRWWGPAGSVSYTYQMGKYDVTVGQYVEFLNAVAKADPYGLYNSRMATDMPTIRIARSGSPGSYSYSVAGSYGAGANCPAFDITFGDAARFCNWLQNGQPVGILTGDPTQDATFTEGGAYSINGATSQAALYALNRNAGARYWIPSLNEWFKAAYYKGGSTNAGYWTYPTKSDSSPSNVLASTGTNNDACGIYIEPLPPNNAYWSYSDPVNHLTPVGAFAASPGPYGTFDMGGDVMQWNESKNSSSSGRGLYGGRWWFPTFGTQDRAHADASNPPQETVSDAGFRIATIPEPSSAAILLAGAVGLLTCCWQRVGRPRLTVLVGLAGVLAVSVAEADVFNMPNG